MIKNRDVKLVLIACIMAFFLNLFFGRYLTAKFSTLPILNRFKIINPQTPIVINTREEVRVNDNSDILNANSQLRQKIGALFLAKDSNAEYLGTVINLTDNGLVVGMPLNLPTQKKDQEQLYVKFYDGSFAKAKIMSLDPYTRLSILQTEAKNLPVAHFSDLKQLQLGQKLGLMSAGLKDQSSEFYTVEISSFPDQNLRSDYPNSPFLFSTHENAAVGAVLFNSNAEVVGLWDGKQVISSKNLKTLFQIYTKDKKLQRPFFGFTYKVLQPWEKTLFAFKDSGIIILSIPDTQNPSPAAVSGLKSGDIITSIEGVSFSDPWATEEFLQKLSPGQKVSLSVLRGEQKLNLTLTAGTLK